MLMGRFVTAYHHSTQAWSTSSTRVTPCPGRSWRSATFTATFASLWVGVRTTRYNCGFHTYQGVRLLSHFRPTDRPIHPPRTHQNHKQTTQASTIGSSRTRPTPATASGPSAWGYTARWWRSGGHSGGAPSTSGTTRCVLRTARGAWACVIVMRRLPGATPPHPPHHTRF